MHVSSLFLDCVLSVKTEIERVKPMLWNSNETNRERKKMRQKNDQARTIAIILWLVKQGKRKKYVWWEQTDSLYHHSTTTEFDIQGAVTLELTLFQRTLPTRSIQQVSH